MADGITLALVGATSMAGESILTVLENSSLKPSELFLVDSDDGAGERVRHRGKEYVVQSLADFDFSQADVAIFATDSELSAAFARKAVNEGSFVVDASGHFCGDESVPLVLAQVNPQVIESAEGGLVAIPSAATAQLVTVLKPLHDAIGIECVDVTAMLAASEMGKAGVDELSSQAVSLFNMREVKSELFPQQLVFNAIPQAGSIDSNGVSTIEQAIADECHTLLGDSALPLHLTAAWIPVFFGHSLAVHLQFSTETSVAAVEETLSNIPEIQLAKSPSAVEPAANQEGVFVGRIRQDTANQGHIQLWIVADNVRFGLARNVITIAEILEKSFI